jgi:hypothetical protein
MSAADKVCNSRKRERRRMGRRRKEKVWKSRMLKRVLGKLRKRYSTSIAVSPIV